MMKISLVLSFLAVFSNTIAGQSTPITRAEFDQVMAKAHERAAAREAGPNRTMIWTSSVFENSGASIGRDVTSIDSDGAGNTRSQTVTFSRLNSTKRETITVGGRKWERINGGSWDITEFEPRPLPPPKPYVNPYPETATFWEFGPNSAATRRFEIVYSKKAKSEGAPEYTEVWTVMLILHQGELINMRQNVRASGPTQPTRTEIEYQFSWLPPFKILPPVPR